MVVGIKGVKSGEDSLASTRRTNRLWRCPSIDVNARSRDCDTNDALELYVYESSNETNWVVHPTCFLMKTSCI